MALLARGARRPRSAIRGLLMAFQPLELGWAGKGDVLTLMKAEWQGGQPLLAGEALFCGYYLNECSCTCCRARMRMSICLPAMVICYVPLAEDPSGKGPRSRFAPLRKLCFRSWVMA